MSGPIRVHVKVVGDQPIKVDAIVPRRTQKIEVKAPIIQDNTPEYGGPYSVQPTEEQQALETEGLKMTEDVTVEAIPSDYVGSAVPRKTSSDLTASGPTVSAPAGYYEEAASKTIPNATPMPGLHAVVSPSTVTVNANGLVNASVGSTTQAIAPVGTAGYAPSNFAAMFAIYGGSKTLQLDTQTGSTITPTESEQTAVAKNKYTTGVVKVAGIPSDYVGSGISQRTDADIDISGPQVSIPEGYYDASHTVEVNNGEAITPETTIPVSPSISVSNTGLITSSVSDAQSITPSVTEGYISSGTPGTVSVSGSATEQLSTQAGATITPTESVQTAVASGKYTTGAVKVGAISSNYVGSGVARKTSSDLVVSDDTVTAPAGYYETAASATVQSATWKSASTIGVVPSISVDANGLITATASGWTSCKPLSASGYADADTSANLQLSGSKTLQLDTIGATTYTPSNVAQEIAAGQYLTGAQTISAIAPPYYDMSGANAWLGAGATLVQTFTLADVKLSATDFNTWTPSTTATDILATRTAGTFTASDMPDYDYYVLWETKVPIVYLSGSTNKAKGLYLAAFHVQALVRRASSYANLQAGNLNSNVNLSAFTGGNFYRYYNATQDNLTYTNNTSYGFYGTVTANTFSSSTATSPTVTLKTPKVTAICSTTYLSTGNASLIDQTNTIISQKCTVYKVKAPSFMRGIWNNVMRMVQEIDPA